MMMLRLAILLIAAVLASSAIAGQAEGLVAAARDVFQTATPFSGGMALRFP
jgi:hypothetical protein